MPADPTPAAFSTTSPSEHLHFSMTQFHDDEGAVVGAEIDDLIDVLRKVRETLPPAPTSTPASDAPPMPKYTLNMRITGNDHVEITDELRSYLQGGYLLDSDYGKRDAFQVTGGRGTRVLEHTNPEMTPQRYDAELSEWFQRRKARPTNGDQS